MQEASWTTEMLVQLINWSSSKFWSWYWHLIQKSTPKFLQYQIWTLEDFRLFAFEIMDQWSFEIDKISFGNVAVSRPPYFLQKVMIKAICYIPMNGPWLKQFAISVGFCLLNLKERFNYDNVKTAMNDDCVLGDGIGDCLPRLWHKKSRLANFWATGGRPFAIRICSGKGKAFCFACTWADRNTDSSPSVPITVREPLQVRCEGW